MSAVEWRVDPGLTDYAAAVSTMEARAAAIHRGEARELIWLVEHPPLYTAGTSARAEDVINAQLPVITTGRGGRHTYHGPGQRVIYVLLDLGARGRDVRCFVGGLETWLIATLAHLGVTAFTVPGRVGVWTQRLGNELKIAAIGVRVRRWVTLHGAAINVAPNLDHFAGIIPCGIADAGITSLADLELATTLSSVDAALKATQRVLLEAVPWRYSMSLEQRDHFG